MDFFNYFIKQFIRIFTKKFFWIILIGFLFFLVFFFDFGSNATYAYFDITNESGAVVKQLPDIPVGNSNVSCFYYYPSASTWWFFNCCDVEGARFVLVGSNHIIRAVDPDGNYCQIHQYAHNPSNNRWQESYVLDNLGSADGFNNYHLSNMYASPSITYESGNIFKAQNCNYNLGSLPFISTSQSDVESWSFNYLDINLGTVNPYYTHVDQQVFKDFVLDIGVNNTTYHVNISGYYTSSGVFHVPKSYITKDFLLSTSQDISFSLWCYSRYLPETETYLLGTYSVSLSSTAADDYNSESQKFSEGQSLENQQEIIQGINDVNSTITDSNIDDITSTDLPTDNTTDITRDGINGIFTSIYNAFCVGTPQDIVFPFPFTNKTIILSPTYISDSLTNSGASWIILIIQAFWWYLISRFIIKDIANKMNKIKSGDIEKIETSNIKGDML